MAQSSSRIVRVPSTRAGTGRALSSPHPLAWTVGLPAVRAATLAATPGAEPASSLRWQRARRPCGRPHNWNAACSRRPCRQHRLHGVRVVMPTWALDAFKDARSPYLRGAGFLAERTAPVVIGELLKPVRCSRTGSTNPALAIISRKTFPEIAPSRQVAQAPGLTGAICVGSSASRIWSAIWSMPPGRRTRYASSKACRLRSTRLNTPLEMSRSNAPSP